MSLLLLHTKVASSAAPARTATAASPHTMRAPEKAVPYTGDLRCGSPLERERLRTRYKSSQCIRVAAHLRTVAAAVSLRVVARCGARHPAIGDNALRAAEKGRLSTRSNGT